MPVPSAARKQDESNVVRIRSARNVPPDQALKVRGQGRVYGNSDMGAGGVRREDAQYGVDVALNE